jgi:uncharacterized protein YejL (UPF0352 family)
MSNNKQSSVEQLVNSLIKLGYLHSNGFGQSLKVTEVINQAKAMHKEEIIQAVYSHTLMNAIEEDPMGKSEQYYNETFDSK